MPWELWNLPFDINVAEEFQLKKLRHTDYDLSFEQIYSLRKRGTKYEELRKGNIRPCSPKQKHFVAMCRFVEPPQDEWEETWRSYLLTLEEEKRLEELHCPNLETIQRREEYMSSRFLGGSSGKPEETSSVPAPALSNDDRMRKCNVCRASGMKGDGDNCDSCNGWGWLEPD